MDKQYHESMKNPLYLPFRAHGTVKNLFLAIVFGGVMPIVAPFLTLLLALNLPVDRLNLLGRFEPAPQVDALSLRYSLEWILPLAVFLHVAGGSFVYTHLEMRAQDLPFLEVVVRPMPLVYLCFSAAVTIFLIGDLSRQRRLAIRHGLVTPWQLLAAPVYVYDGFVLAGAGAAEQSWAQGQNLVTNKDAAAHYYNPPVRAAPVRGTC